MDYKKFVFVALGFCTLNIEAGACGHCSDAILWSTFPPLRIWPWVGVILFVAISAIGSSWDKKIPGSPKIVKGLTLVFIISLIGYKMIGSIVGAPFLLFAFISVAAVFVDRAKDFPKEMKVQVASAAVVALLVIAVTGLMEVINPTVRTPVETILKWSGTFPGMQAFNKLKKNEPNSADDYRRLVKELEGFYVGEAASRLAVIGDQLNDVPLLIDAYEREQKVEWGVSEYVEAALKNLSRLPLPKNTSVDDWRKAWDAKLLEVEDGLKYD